MLRCADCEAIVCVEISEDLAEAVIYHAGVEVARRPLPLALEMPVRGYGHNEAE